MGSRAVEEAAQGTDRADASKGEDGAAAGAQAEPPLSAGLYLVATPIGNAADITLRALGTLRRVGAIACEDTRTTAKLLAIHGISRPLLSYHEHNATVAGPAILARLLGGEAVALVSDAGTPLVSDPGYRLVRACVDVGLPVVPVPGPSAILAALSVSGLPTDRFLFAGFPPPRQTARRRFLEGLASVDATLVLLESPQRLAASLADMADVLGARDAAVCRELTKLFEEIRRAPLPALARHYEEAGAPKGEVTLVISPPAPAEALVDAEVDALLAEALEAGETVRTAAERIADASGRPRREVYARALARRREQAGGT
jgi:16S rRNA (cytidine1402-2'-O)-methyltransferase